MEGEEAAREAERALELADEALARLDVDALVAHLSAGVRGFTAAGDVHRGAMTCARLGDMMANALGNLTAGRAWFARARRLLEDQPPCLEQGWVAVAAMGCDVDDPDELLAAAQLALELARRFGEMSLETKALADAGLAHVQAGRIGEGMGLLDEAMALACGPAQDEDLVAKSVCSFFTACYVVADYERAGNWAELLRRRGIIGPAPGGPVFLSSHCDSVQATLLMELGRWSEAEEVLVRAKQAFESTMLMPAWHPDLALADLRVRQGRLADAESLLLGKDQSLQALMPSIRLHLARGDHELAAALAERAQRALAGDRVRMAELLVAVVDVELGRGDLGAAGEACARLDELLEGVQVPPLRARAGVARSRVLAARSELEGAVEQLERALTQLDPVRLPLLHTTMLLELAALRERAGRTDLARRDAAAAGVALAELDVTVDADAVALLGRLVPAADTAGADRRVCTATLSGDGRWWQVDCDGTIAKLRDTKGLRYLAELIARPGAERHALDLVDAIEGVDPDRMVGRRGLGDAGEQLDGEARRAYRRRIEELRSEADEALALGREDHAEACQGEVEQLVQQLAGAFGLGGGTRTAASAAERARLNVTRALRAAINAIAEVAPGPAAVLDRRVRTGTYCVYDPEDSDEARWVVQR